MYFVKAGPAEGPCDWSGKNLLELWSIKHGRLASMHFLICNYVAKTVTCVCGYIRV